MCPRVNDDQKIDVDDQKLSSGRPHDYGYWILKRLFDKILYIFPISFTSYTALQKKYTGGRQQLLVEDRFFNVSRPLTTRF